MRETAASELLFGNPALLMFAAVLGASDRELAAADRSGRIDAIGGVLALLVDAAMVELLTRLHEERPTWRLSETSLCRPNLVIALAEHDCTTFRMVKCNRQPE